MGKNIGVIDADLIDGGTKHPNLALMKISGYHKSLGDNVSLLMDYNSIPRYDLVWVSKVFDSTQTPSFLSELGNVRIGGTGFFGIDAPNLPNEIEHHKPDYDLYSEYVKKRLEDGEKRSALKDYLDYSIGFTTRGCFRKCSFCVNRKYSKVHKHSPLNEFLDMSKKYIYLWDDNFLGFCGWESILDELIETKKYFQFRQGLDIRLMTKEKAHKLSKCKYHGDWIFAFDHIQQKEVVSEKLKIWKTYVKKTTKLYVLCGYESQCENDIVGAFERVRVLMELGCLPYIMRYKDYEQSEFRGIYITLARWCNQPNIFKKKSFRQFCEMEVNKGAPMRYLREFEERFPDIANKYFDMRYEDLNQYK